MLWGESLFSDIRTLVYDCHDCKHVKDDSCPEWCHDFIKSQIQDICDRVKRGEYEEVSHE